MKTKLLLKSLCILVISMAFFVSCDDDDDEIKIEPAVSLAESSHAFTNGAGDYALAVFANAGWTLSQEGDWYSVDKTSGSGNAVVKVNATENKTGAERTGKITVKSEGLSDQVFQLTQSKEDVVLKVLGEDSYLIKPEGGVMEITLEANVSYTYEMTSWVRALGGFDLSQAVIRINIEPNLWGSTRETTVVIKNAKDATVVKEIKLTQESVLVDVPEQVLLDGKGGKGVLIPLSEDMSWILDESYVDKASWLNCNQTEEGFIVIAEKNEDAQSRHIALSFTEEATGFRKAVMVEQESYAAIQLDLTTELGVGGSSEVGIESAFEESMFRRYVKRFTHGDQVVVSSEEDWIHPSLEGSMITIQVDRNDGEGAEVREGDVMVTAMDGEREMISKKIHVSQGIEQTDAYINVNEMSHKFTFGNSGETFEVVVDANVDWIITDYEVNSQISYVIDGDKIVFTYTQMGGPIFQPLTFAVHRVGFTPQDDELCKKIEITTTLP